MIAPVEEALRSVLTTMAEKLTETWTISELYSVYPATSGTVSGRQLSSCSAAQPTSATKCVCFAFSVVKVLVDLKPASNNVLNLPKNAKVKATLTK